MTTRRHRHPSPHRIADELCDPVPAEVVVQARAAFTMRAPGPLAPLVFDSADTQDGATDERTLRFADRSVTVEVLVAQTEPHRTIIGHVDPPPLLLELDLQGADGTIIATAADGDFRFESVPHGPTRLRLRRHDQPVPLCTDWFTT